MTGDGGPVAPVESVRTSAFAPRTTTFIGRDGALDDIASIVRTRRLVTLVGPGGCGKTSLALEAGRALEAGYADGAVFVDLASVPSGDVVANAFAAAAGVPELVGVPLADLIVAALAGRRQLMLVDNCERVVDACAPIVDAIIRGCPGLIVLATSREPLGVDGETTWRVPSLTLPPADTQDDLAALAKSGAGQLLLDRARLARPDLEWSAADTRAATQICRRLDGIPLALELAASRLRAYSPVELVAGLNDCFALLTGGPRTAPPRQRTLEASISWSYELLDEPAASLLRRLSVFAGAFVLDDAQAVCERAGIVARDIWSLLADLVDRSLVQSEPGGYRLLESVAQYAARRLSAHGEEEAARRAHLNHFAAVAHHFNRQPETAGLTDRIERLLGDLRSAMDWALHAGHPVDAVRLAADLRLFWVAAGRAQEGRMWLEAGLAAAGDTDPTVRAHALLAAAHLALIAFDPRRQGELVTEALRISRSAGDPQLESRAMVHVGWSQLFADPAAARRLLEEGREMADRLGEAVRVEFASFGCGTAAMLSGDLRGALAELVRAVEMATQRGSYGVVFGRGALGYVHLLTGHVDAAIELTAEALERDGHDTRTLPGQWHALALGHRGRFHEARAWIGRVAAEASGTNSPTHLLAVDTAWLDVAEADAQSAIARLGEALPALQAVGASWYETQARCALAEASAATGDVATASEQRRKAMDVAERSGNPLSRTVALIALGRSCDGDAARARSLLRDAIRSATRAGYTLGLIDATEALAVHGFDGATVDAGERARLLDAVDAVRAHSGYVRRPIDEDTYRRARDASDAPTLTGDVADPIGVLHEAVAAAFRSDRRPPRPTEGWQSLTPAELRVSLLVAEGLTNPEIGERLFLSRRTVQSHLSRVFAKLSVSGRAELAAALTRRAAGES